MASVHVARIAVMNINRNGTVVSKNDPTTTIADQLQTSMDHRIIVDTAIPNSAGNPSVKQYLELEAAANYIMQYLDQNTVVTYLRNSTGGYP